MCSKILSYHIYFMASMVDVTKRRDGQV